MQAIHPPCSSPTQFSFASEFSSRAHFKYFRPQVLQIHIPHRPYLTIPKPSPSSSSNKNTFTSYPQSSSHPSHPASQSYPAPRGIPLVSRLAFRTLPIISFPLSSNHQRTNKQTHPWPSPPHHYSLHRPPDSHYSPSPPPPPSQPHVAHSYDLSASKDAPLQFDLPI